MSFPLINGAGYGRLVATITMAYFLVLSLTPQAATISPPSQPQPQQPPPPPPPPPERTLDGSSLGFSMIVIFAFLFLICFCTVYCCPHPNPQPLPGAAPSDSVQRSLPPLLLRRNNNGLDPAVIDSFPTVEYAAVQAHHLEKQGYQLECAVCLYEFEEDETLRLIPNCDHAFHPHCIDPWLRSNSTCPVCRADLKLPPPARRHGGGGNNSAAVVGDGDDDARQRPPWEPSGPIARTEVNTVDEVDGGGSRSGSSNRGVAVVEEFVDPLGHRPPVVPPPPPGNYTGTTNTSPKMSQEAGGGNRFHPSRKVEISTSRGSDSDRDMERPIIHRPGEVEDDDDLERGGGARRRRAAVLNRYWSYRTRQMSEQLRSIEMFFRSKSTGRRDLRSSSVGEWERTTGRFTLRVPEEVRNRIMSGTLSPIAVRPPPQPRRAASMPRGGGSRRGQLQQQQQRRQRRISLGRRHSDGGGGHYGWLERAGSSSSSSRQGNSTVSGWVLSLTPPFLSRSTGEKKGAAVADSVRGGGCGDGGGGRAVLSSASQGSPAGLCPPV